jgi:cyanate permease
VSSSGAAIGPWATGMLFDVSGNYETAFIVAMVLCVLSTLAMWAASPRKIILVAGMARVTNS